MPADYPSVSVYYRIQIFVGNKKGRGNLAALFDLFNPIESPKKERTTLTLEISKREKKGKGLWLQ